jgi:hypothetical protein
MSWLSDVGGQIVAGVVLLAIGVMVGWFSNRRSERKRAEAAASEWTLEHIKDDRWTLRRDSPKRALDTWLWLGDEDLVAGSVALPKFSGTGRERPDFKRGDIRELVHLNFGQVLAFGWIEDDSRWEVRTLTRESVPKLTIVRADIQRTRW